MIKASVGGGAAGNTFDWPSPIAEHHTSHDESGNRPGDSNVEKRPPRMNRRANPDECAHGSDQRGKRNEERQGGVHVVVNAGQIVPHLVRQQDQHQARREGNAQKQTRRMVPDQVDREESNIAVVFVCQGRALVQVVVFEVRAHDEGREDGGKQQQGMEPIALAPPGRQHHGHRSVILHGRARKGWRWVRHGSFVDCKAVGERSADCRISRPQISRR